MPENKQQYGRFGEVVNVTDVILPVHKALEHLGEDYLILSFATHQGEEGEFLLLTAVHQETGEECVVSTGSWMVKAQLEHINQKIDLPRIGKFVEDGKSYFIE